MVCIGYIFNGVPHRVRSVHGASVRRGGAAGRRLDSARVAAAPRLLHAGRPGAPRATASATRRPRHSRAPVLQERSRRVATDQVCSVFLYIVIKYIVLGRDVKFVE